MAPMARPTPGKILAPIFAPAFTIVPAPALPAFSITSDVALPAPAPPPPLPIVDSAAKAVAPPLPIVDAPAFTIVDSAAFPPDPNRLLIFSIILDTDLPAVPDASPIIFLNVCAASTIGDNAFPPAASVPPDNAPLVAAEPITPAANNPAVPRPMPPACTSGDSSFLIVGSASLPSSLPSSFLSPFK